MKNLKYLLTLLIITSLVSLSFSQTRRGNPVDHRKGNTKNIRKSIQPKRPSSTRTSTSSRKRKVVDNRRKSTSRTSSNKRSRPATRTTTNNNRSSASAKRKSASVKVRDHRTNTSHTTKSKAGYVWKNGHWEREKASKESRLRYKWNRVNSKYLTKMEKIVTSLNHTNDVWAKDTFMLAFESMRRLKIKRDYLDHFPTTLARFNTICNDFDNKYDNQQKIIEIRKKEGLDILVEGKVSKLSTNPFNYYPLPNQAKLLSVRNQNTGEFNALGFILYQSTGDNNLKLSIDVELNIDQLKVNEIKDLFSGYGIELSNKFPTELVDIEEQDIKIKGLPATIIPLGQRNARIEITLPDEQLSLIKLFSGPIEFNLDYTIQNKLKPLSQKLSLEVDQAILDQFNPKEALASFSTMENTSFSGYVKISSLLDAAKKDEEALNRVEVTLEFQFQNETIIQGPFRLSADGTMASDQTVQFLKHSDDFKIKVSGKAFYENGTRDIKTFITTDQIILIDEDTLK